MTESAPLNKPKALSWAIAPWNGQKRHSIFFANKVFPEKKACTHIFHLPNRGRTGGIQFGDGSTLIHPQVAGQTRPRKKPHAEIIY